MTHLSRYLTDRRSRKIAVTGLAIGALAVAATVMPLASAQARTVTPKAKTTKTTVVSSAKSSLCINPSGISESGPGGTTWGDGSPAPSSPSPSLPSYPPNNSATNTSNPSATCNPPASLASLTNPVVEGAPGAAVCGYGNIAGASWVGVQPACSDSDNPPPSTEDNNVMYIYDAAFSLPQCYSNPSISGSMEADNGVAAYLNNNLLGYQSIANGGGAANFSNPPTAFSSANASFFQSGANEVDFLVEDHSTAQTAVDFSATITYTPAKACGTLKICKVAGFGVAVGTTFTFNVTTLAGTETVTVPAGPAPGGYCVVVGTFPTGAYKVTEVIPAGDSVTSITGIPAGHATLGTGTFTGKLGTGVTEVTYTDQSIPQGGQTGYLEICKQAQAPAGAVLPSVFVFTVDGQTVAVPPGACSPATEVLAGSETVTETPIAPYVMSACSTIPAADLVSCNPTGNTATVTVNPGGVAAETILTVTNVVSAAG